MCRELTSHKVNGLNERIVIEATDHPGAGGASHVYEVFLDRYEESVDDIRPECVISFQNGPIQEAGFNGISNEALLAIVEDRLKGFQSGDFACRENALALTKIQEAMMWLQRRTRERMARGDEGTLQK